MSQVSQLCVSGHYENLVQIFVEVFQSGPKEMEQTKRQTNITIHTAVLLVEQNYFIINNMQ